VKQLLTVPCILLQRLYQYYHRIAHRHITVVLVPYHPSSVMKHRVRSSSLLALFISIRRSILWFSAGIYFGLQLHSFFFVSSNLECQRELDLLRRHHNIQNESLISHDQHKQISKLKHATTIVSMQNNQNPFSMEVYLERDIVSKQIQKGGWEVEKVSAFNTYFLQYSKRHNIPLSKLFFVDIGANIGWFTLNMAALGVNVLAFEPMEENIQLLEKSLSLPENVASGISDRITLFRHGLGVKNQTCVVYSHNINVGDGHVKCLDEDEEGSMEKKLHKIIPHNYSIRGRIPIRRLDDVIQTYREKRMKHSDDDFKVVCVKMDTEGYEGNVLEGGTGFLLESGLVDVIITEFVPKWLEEKGGDPVEFMSKMKDAGYRVVKTNVVLRKLQEFFKMYISIGRFRYMSSEEMVDMSNFPKDDLTIHSPTFIKKQ